MDADTLRITGVLYFVVAIFGIALVIAWIVLPFAVIGTKPLLRELIAETREVRNLLAQQVRTQNSGKDLPGSDPVPGVRSNR